MSTINPNQWFTEIAADTGSAISLKITRQLDEVQSPFQKVTVFETEEFGNLMIIDGCTMVSTRENFIYHEMMSHPAIFSHPNPKNVVIIGGGDCGTLREVLKHPGVETAHQIDIDEVVTRMAEKYFPDQSAVGQTLTYRNNVDFEISAVIDNVPDQSHLAINALISINSALQVVGQNALDSWIGSRCYTYIKVAEGTELTQLEERIADVISRHGSADPQYEANYYLMPLDDIHLHSSNYNEMKPNGDINNIYVFVAICLIMLIVVAINFINLSTVRAMKRAKEVGVRKSIGASRGQLIFQFLLESVILTAVAAVVSMVLTMVMLPTLSDIFARSFDHQLLFSLNVIAFLVVVTLLIGILAGLYPAVFLSGFEPARVLKGDVTRGNSGAAFRKSLVSFQFVITTFLIICAVFMAMQMHYVTSERIGYNVDDKIMVRIPYGQFAAYPALRNELLKHPDVETVIGSSSVPTESVGDKRNFRKSTNKSQRYVFTFIGTQPGFFDFYKFEMVAGRDFSEDMSTDKYVAPKNGEEQVPAGFIINEMAARDFGWTVEESIGKQVEMPITKTQFAKGEVIGVIKDTNFDSFRNDSVPIVFYYDETENSRISLKISGENTPEVLQHIELTWRKVLPEETPQVRFLDLAFDNLYKNESQQLQLFTVLAGISIFLSLLGLYGLSAYNAERRAKEIAIRKVLGASTSRIIRLLSKETLALVLIANLIAWPLSYYVVQGWLSGFVYRVDISLVVFLVASVCAFMLAWSTLAIQALIVSARPVVTSLHCD